MLSFSTTLLLLLITFCTKSLSLQVTSTPPLLDSPTYSLATLNEDGTTNMNIVTYATPVSARPTRVWSLGLFKETRTAQNILRKPVCVLQLLSREQAKLVVLLGGFSGNDLDKRSACADLDFPWEDLGADMDDIPGIQVLPGCKSYMAMAVQGGLVDVGSHLVAPVCQVEQMFEDDKITSDTPLLSTGLLRRQGLITEQGRVAEDALEKVKASLLSNESTK